MNLSPVSVHFSFCDLEKLLGILVSVDGRERGRCAKDGRQRFTGSLAIPPNGFIVKDSQMGTLHIFPAPTCSGGGVDPQRRYWWE